MINEVTVKLHTHKTEIQDPNGHCYELKIKPYITEEKRIDSATITFHDIDEIKKSKEKKKKQTNSLFLLFVILNKRKNIYDLNATDFEKSGEPSCLHLVLKIIRMKWLLRLGKLKAR